MRKCLLVVAAVALCAACTMWKAQKPSWSNATGGEKLERLLWQEIKARNTAELEKHMAATFVFLTPAGPLDRAATLEHVKKLEITEYSLGDFNVQPNGTDLIVTYTATLRGASAGQPLPPGPMRMMTVWQEAPKAKEGWVAIAHVDVR